MLPVDTIVDTMDAKDADREVGHSNLFCVVGNTSSLSYATVSNMTFWNYAPK